MAKNKPDLKIELQFKSGKHFVISLYLMYGGWCGRYFDITFTDSDGTRTKSKRGGTITHVVDRIRRLIVREI